MSPAKRNQLMNELERIEVELADLEEWDEDDEEELSQLALTRSDLEYRRSQLLDQFPEVRFWPPIHTDELR